MTTSGAAWKTRTFPRACLYPDALVKLISLTEFCWWHISSNNYNSSYRANTEEWVGVFKPSLGNAQPWETVDLRLILMQVNCVLTGERRARISEVKLLSTGKQQPQLNLHHSGQGYKSASQVNKWNLFWHAVDGSLSALIP